MFSKVLKISKLLSVFGSAQVIVQGTTVLSGLLVVRWLAPSEYALYTIAITMQSTMNILADAGIGGGVMAQGGKEWKNPNWLGSVMATGLALRRRFAPISMLVTMPILIYMLRDHGATWGGVAMVFLGVTITFSSTLSGGLLEIVPKLHQKVVELSRIQFCQALARLGIVFGSLLMMPLAGVALTAAAIPQIWVNWRLRLLSRQYATPHLPEDPAVKKEILGIVKRALPGAIFYSFSSQLTLWLIAILGNSVTISQVGALGRISQLSIVFTMLMGTVFVPRFARLPQSPSLLTKWFFGITGISLICGSFMTGFVALFPDLALWLLGKNYNNLHREVVLSIITAAVWLMTNTTGALASSRGWIISPWISIPSVLGSQVVIIPFIDFSKAEGALWFGVFSSIMPLLCHYGYALYRIRQVHMVLRKSGEVLAEIPKVV